MCKCVGGGGAKHTPINTHTHTSRFPICVRRNLFLISGTLVVLVVFNRRHTIDIMDPVIRLGCSRRNRRRMHAHDHRHYWTGFWVSIHRRLRRFFYIISYIINYACQAFIYLVIYLFITFHCLFNWDSKEYC